jgi:tetratricopeptide (TPR) repeat protein
MASRIGRGHRVALVIAALLLGLWLRHQLVRMDALFFHFSWSGAQGLARYLAGDYGGAARAYRAHLRDRYTHHATTGDPTWDAVLRGDQAAAERAASAAIQADRGDVAAWLTLADVALERGQHAAAVAHTGEVLARQPRHFEALLLRSVAFARSGEHGAAIDALHAGLATGRPESRITSFLRALEVAGDLASRPRRDRPLCLLAQYHRYLQIFDPSNGGRAVRYAEAAVAAGDRPADAYLAIGIVEYFRGRPERALEAVRRGLEVEARHPEVLRWASVLYGERGDVVNEYAMARAAVAAAPDETNIDRLAWVALEKVGEPHEAIAAARAALALRPDNARALSWLGRGHALLGEHEAALRAFERAAAVEASAELFDEAGDNLVQLGRFPAAVAMYQRALALEPERQYSRKRLADTYRRLGRYHDAIEEFQRAYRFGVSSATDLNVLCVMYHETQQFRRMAECYRAVLRMRPDDSHARMWLPFAVQAAERERAR